MEQDGDTASRPEPAAGDVQGATAGVTEGAAAAAVAKVAAGSVVTITAPPELHGIVGIVLGVQDGKPLVRIKGHSVRPLETDS
jgi:hypothetical protein